MLVDVSMLRNTKQKLFCISVHYWYHTIQFKNQYFLNILNTFTAGGWGKPQLRYSDDSQNVKLMFRLKPLNLDNQRCRDDSGWVGTIYILCRIVNNNPKIQCNRLVGLVYCLSFCIKNSILSGFSNYVQILWAHLSI